MPPYAFLRPAGLLVTALALLACGGDDSAAPSPPADATTDTSPADASDATATDGGPENSAPDPDSGQEDANETGSDAGDQEGDTLTPPACLPAGEWVDHTLGDWTVSVDPRSISWQVAGPDGLPPVAALRRCDDAARDATVRLATGVPAFRTSFGRLDVTWEGGRDGLTWWEPSGPAAAPERTGDRLSLRVPFGDGGEALLVFELQPTGDLEVRLAPMDGDERALAGELVWGLGDGGLFGLGAQVTGLDLRGRTFPLHVQEQGNGKPEGGRPYPLANVPEASYAPMGVLHAEAGWSGLLVHDGVHEVELGSVASDRLALRSYPEPPGFVFVRGATPAERLSAITEWIGRPPPAADWMFFPWNDTVGGPEKVRTLAERLRAEGIPSAALWAEDWIGGSLTANGFRLSYAWVWDEATYPQLPDLVAELEDDGFSFLAYFNTFVPDNLPTFEPLAERGWLVQNEDGAPYEVTDPAFRTAGLIDLSNPDAADHLREQMRTATDDLGIRGWMADFTEWMPVDGRLASGTSGWTYHNQWPLDFQRVNRSVYDALQPAPDEPADFVFFVRSGWASKLGGTAGLVTAMWMGDQMTSFDAEDGLATTIPIGAHLGLAGIAVVGSDIAGYQSIGVGNTSKELFFRWASMGALHPLMRTHQGSDKCLNWTFDRDPETLAHYRRWAIVHTLLLPEWRRLHAAARAHGLPIVRHPWLVAPDRPALWAEGRRGFFVGDDLHVVPVVEPGVTRWDVELPGEGWWPLFGDAPQPPGTTFTVDAPPSALPVWVRPGTALVLLPEVVDTPRSVAPDRTDVRTLAQVADRWRVHLYPSAAGDVATRDDAALPVVGRGLGTTWDVGAATADGVEIATCASREGLAPCRVDGESLVRVAGGTRVEVGAATVEVGGDASQTVDLVVGGRFWPERVDEEPTEIDLASDAPPTCEVD